MDLKKGIVIKNRFSVMRDGVGTRGSTPGMFVSRYVTRDDAGEPLYPVSNRPVNSYIDDYMMREDAVEKVWEGKSRGHRADGIAFTSGEISMPYDHVRNMSKELQSLFEKGHTVMECVLSFDDKYLKDVGVLDEGYIAMRRGDHRGHVDQLKLRSAITGAMDKLASEPRFDNLKWLGAIQFDTMHLHCHLVAVDAGEGLRTKEGEQKGCLSSKEKAVFRRALDNNLLREKQSSFYAANVAKDRSTAKAHVRGRVFDAIAEGGMPQVILSILPEDKRLWRAGSRSVDMRRANDVCRAYVLDLLNAPGSGRAEALQDIERYADARVSREGLSRQDRERFVRRGLRRLEDDCMNGVYDILAELPEQELKISTEMIDIIAEDLSVLAEISASNPMADFGYKLRSYSGRVRYHRKERDKYHELVKGYERSMSEASDESRPMYDFYRMEELYQEQVMAKYQSLLGFSTAMGNWDLELEGLLKDRLDYEGYVGLLSDPYVMKMTPGMAEEYGRDRYGVSGGGMILSGSSILLNKLDESRARYEEHERNLGFLLAGDGLQVQWKGEGLRSRPKLVFAPVYEFEDVKALDLHHMEYDMPGDARVSQRCVDQFVGATRFRDSRLVGALDYLNNTGQGFLVSSLPVLDVGRMLKLSEHFEGGSLILPSRRHTPAQIESPIKEAKEFKVRTITADAKYDLEIRKSVRDIATHSGILLPPFAE